MPMTNEEAKTSRVRKTGRSIFGFTSSKTIRVVVPKAIKTVNPRMILFQRGKIFPVFTNVLINIKIDILNKVVNAMNA